MSVFVKTFEVPTLERSSFTLAILIFMFSFTESSPGNSILKRLGRPLSRAFLLYSAFYVFVPLPFYFELLVQFVSNKDEDR